MLTLLVVTATSGVFLIEAAYLQNHMFQWVQVGRQAEKEKKKKKEKKRGQE
jgi:hypothetical protein